MAPLIWLVTGTTSGFGASLVKQITARGDKVIATGRNVETRIGHLKSDKVALLELDIGADAAELSAKFQQAWKIFGHIDVLVNNAGISGSRTVEEAEDEFVQHIFNINTFGPMRLAQASLPLFREQGHGKLIFVSSVSANNPLPFMVHYAASKAALTNMAYGLAAETRSFGIETMIVEPGGFKTDLGAAREGQKAGGEGFGTVPVGAAYQPLFGEFVGVFAQDPDAFFVGESDKGAARIVDAVRVEGMAAGKTLPLHLELGSDALEISRRKLEARLKGLAEWEDVIKSTDRQGATEVGKKIMLKLSVGLGE